MNLDNFTFGWVMLVLGMGITLLTLFLLTVIIRVLSMLFPVKPAGEEKAAVKTEQRARVSE